MGRTALIIFLLLVITASSALAAAGPKVSELNNKHNLRSSNIGVTYHAALNPLDRRNDEICIFCHTPHSAAPSAPLWGRKPTVTNFFGHYSSTTLVIDNPGVRTTSDYNEPNGSSRLCLSCHDGATALGAVLNGPEITFDAAKRVITPSQTQGSYNVFNPTIGDVNGDLIDDDATKHHHPISFKYNATVKGNIYSVKGPGQLCKLPDETSFQDSSTGPVTSPTNPVKLDRNGYMQCTTCHNPHQDMSGDSTNTPFWVTGTAESPYNLHDTVCKTCHSWTTNPP